MSRYVSVRYLVPVYATVDLDAIKEDGSYPDDAVPRVFQSDSGIVRLDHPDIRKLIEGDVFDSSYEGDDEDVDPDKLTPEEREKALDVAENTIWPIWEGG